MSDELVRQAIVDEEHLKLLSIGYVISGATTAFFSLFGLMYMFIGLFMFKAISHQTETMSNGQPPPAFVGYVFGAVGLGIFLFLAILAALKFRTAWCLKHRKSRVFCMIVAGVSCLGIPYGTALGALTFIALGRDSVARLFQ